MGGHTLLHLGNQFLVEEALGLLMEGAVDGDDVTLSQHLLECVHTSAADFLLDVGLEWLVVEVQKLLAVEGLESPQDTLADTADGDGADDFVLEVVFILGDGGDVPVTGLDLLVGGDEVADEGEDGHDDVLGNGDNVGASDFGNGDTAIGGVGGIQVDVVGADTGGDGDLELLRLGKTLSVQVAGVEAVGSRSISRLTRSFLELHRVSLGSRPAPIDNLDDWEHSRGGDDDFSIDQFLVELGVRALLVGRGDQSVALVLEPFSDA